MRIIIAGGTGFIGQALVADLAASGADIVVLSRGGGRRDFPAGVRVQSWDGRTPEGWLSLVEGAHAIVNLAGENIGAGRWTAARKRRIRESRVWAGRAVADAVTAARVKPRVVVQGSAVGYYGPGENEVGEEAAAGSDFLARVCVAWEASSAVVQAQGVRWVAARTGIVLSGDGGVLRRMLVPFRLGLGGSLGSGRQWLPWIHYEDEVRAIRFLLEEEKAVGPMNLSAPHAVTNGEFSRVLARTLKRPALVSVPAFALRLGLGEMATLLLDGQRAVPRRLLELGFEFRFPELEPALRALLNAKPARQDAAG